MSPKIFYRPFLVGFALGNKRAETIARILDLFFPSPQVPLHHKDPYTLLIAVLLSARCTDKKVNEVTGPLFLKADTPEKMIQLTPEEIRGFIRPCGLSPTKSKAIWQLSHDLIEHYQGEVPKTLEELEKLPGVGHKTASVVLSQAFHIPAFPVDTHIYRSARRWGLSSGKTVVQVEKDLKKLFPRSSWNKIHLQIILFARAYCPAKGHAQPCPICSLSSRKR